MIFFLFLKAFAPDIVTYTTLMKAFIRAKKFEKVPYAFLDDLLSPCDWFLAERIT